MFQLSLVGCVSGKFCQTLSFLVSIWRLNVKVSYDFPQLLEGLTLAYYHKSTIKNDVVGLHLILLVVCFGRS